uniref:Putative secreted protein n=1 Tax=Panstrongylus lignarius TaxID=156445 RepID=A0A224Y384_9HEMI
MICPSFMLCFFMISTTSCVNVTGPITLVSYVFLHEPWLVSVNRTASYRPALLTNTEIGPKSLTISFIVEWISFSFVTSHL